MEINAYITPKLNVKEVATICAALLSREKPYEEALAQRLAEELHRAAGEEVIVEPGHVILITQGGGNAILKDEL